MKQRCLLLSSSKSRKFILNFRCFHFFQFPFTTLSNAMSISTSEKIAHILTVYCDCMKIWRKLPFLKNHVQGTITPLPFRFPPISIFGICRLSFLKHSSIWNYLSKKWKCCIVLFEWEFFIHMRASCLPLSFHHTRGATERGWVQNWPYLFEWRALIWIRRHCTYLTTVPAFFSRFKVSIVWEL